MLSQRRSRRISSSNLWIPRCTTMIDRFLLIFVFDTCILSYYYYISQILFTCISYCDIYSNIQYSQVQRDDCSERPEIHVRIEDQALWFSKLWVLNQKLLMKYLFMYVLNKCRGVGESLCPHVIMYVSQYLNLEEIVLQMTDSDPKLGPDGS